MYDCIVLESNNLPAGVTLAAVLEGCDEREVANILDNIPDIHNIQEADLEASGGTLQAAVAGLLSCKFLSWPFMALRSAAYVQPKSFSFVD